MTRDLEATAEAVVDSLADLGAALDDMPVEFELLVASAALAAATRAFDRMLTLLDGHA